MNSIAYDFPSELRITTLLARLSDADDVVARLDERLRSTPFGAAVVERTLCREACASVWSEGGLVHLEDLVLLDGRAFDGPMSAELSGALQVLGIWRRAWRGDAARFLAASRPGEDVEAGPTRLDLPAWLAERKGWDTERLEGWRRVVRRTGGLPPLLAAAVAWDAWLVMLPELPGGWRAPLVGALALKARGRTRSFLMPVTLGARHGTYRRREQDDFTTRMEGFCDWVLAGASEMDKELKRIAVAGDMLRRHVDGRRTHSRLGALADLLLCRQFVSVPMAAKVLGCSPQAVRQMLGMLGSLPREMTGRKRYRVWSV